MEARIFHLFASKKGHENLIWSRRLYIGTEVGPKRRKVIESIQKQKLTKDIFVLMLPMGDSNQLDIIDANYLKQPYYQKRKPVIVGVAQGKSEAISLVLKITQACYDKQGDGDIRTFLRERLREEGTVFE